MSKCPCGRNSEDLEGSGDIERGIGLPYKSKVTLSLENVGAAVVLGKGAANFEQRAQPADLCSAAAWGTMELMVLYRLRLLIKDKPERRWG